MIYIISGWLEVKGPPGAEVGHHLTQSHHGRWEEMVKWTQTEQGTSEMEARKTPANPRIIGASEA